MAVLVGLRGLVVRMDPVQRQAVALRPRHGGGAGDRPATWAVQQPDRLDQHGKPLLRSALDYRQVLLEIDVKRYAASV
jgi:hypothetical protein